MLKKSTLLLLTSLFCVTAMSQSFDEIGLNCIIEQYSTVGVQIDTVLDNYEAFLVRKNHLKKNPKKRYRSFFKNMENENAIIATIPKETYNKIAKVGAKEYLGSNCFSHLEHLDDLNYILLAKISIIGNRIANDHEFGESGPKDMASIFLETFNEADFGNAFMRTLFLLMIGWIAEEENGKVHSFKLLPPPD